MRASLSGICLLLIATACSGGTAAPPTTVGTPSTTETTTGPTTTSSTIPTTTTVPRPLLGNTVVIDPGHNGMNWAHPQEIGRLVDIGNGSKACNTTGTSTSVGYTEAEFTWTLAQLVVARLEDLGATVVLTRQDNDGWGPCIDERAAIGNRNNADAVISIHADGGPESGRGFHVIRPADTVGLTDDIYEASARLAAAVHDLYMETGMPVADYIGAEGYTARDDLGGLNLSDVPAVFLETGNMRNAEDAALLTDPRFRDAAAAAITSALVRFLVG
ncbi:MAG: N-acetylmuramoyl-L-alanine amidase [Acidimicrobiia bacterium]